jgi:lipopolysaccharide transport system ATP-binding protein
MSSDLALAVNHLGKCYQIYDKPHHRLLQMLLARVGKTYYREFWALRDVSFQIPKGKVVGILGKNGAGKSTLLQIICGTLTPTDGTVDVRGRVAALLELGSGFNPEFTGIENIYLNGQILGLDGPEVDDKLNAILEFADIGDFVYQPVKTYSSGMFARLAFSVAVNVEPDLLIVDEALSVGDAWFQHKSMARMRQLMESGCSVLFVSHSIDAVRALCDEAIWLDQGRVKMQGNVTDVTNAYMNDVFVERNKILLGSARYLEDKQGESVKPEETEDNRKSNHTTELKLASNDLQTSQIELKKAAVVNSIGEQTDHLLHNEDFEIVVEFSAGAELYSINVGFLISDQFGQALIGGNLLDKNVALKKLRKGEHNVIRFGSKMRLRGGQSYGLSIRFTQGICPKRTDMVVLSMHERLLVFEVLTGTEPNWLMFDNEYEAKVGPRQK